MAAVVVLQMPAFKRACKRLPAGLQSAVTEAVRAIVANPDLGEEKRGDLAGICVYKFPVNRRQMLLAYEWEPKSRVLLMLGNHENFYRDLKRK